MTSPILERHFTPAELAEAWSLSEDSIRRLFDSEPDVLILSAPKKRGKRAYKTIRIPQGVAERVYHRLRRAA